MAASVSMGVTEALEMDEIQLPASGKARPRRSCIRDKAAATR